MSRHQTPEPSREPASSRAAILAAARRRFSSVGYTATSMSDIVAEAGTSAGLPYYHFGSKKGLFLTIWAEYQRLQRQRTRTAIDDARASGGVGAGLLLVGIRAYLDGAWSNRQILPMVHGSDRPPGFDEEMRAGAERWNRQMLALLSEYDQHFAGVALLMLTEALSRVCLQLSRCTSEKQAQQTILDAVRLSSSMLEALPREDGRVVYHLHPRLGRIGPQSSNGET
ncbi:MAG: helix-turn-helix transcriptional regulator [Acidimicrobiaceae bacterium]|nr:helix-turn-helix transcriptional regulator [Acidimicrobiaceae bacterium]